MAKIEELFRDISSMIDASGKDRSAPKAFIWKGVTYWSGLGTLHAQEGFPLCCSLEYIAKSGGVPCLTSAEVELLNCGCHPDKAKRIVLQGIKEMICDVPDSWSSMRANLPYLKEVGR